MKSPNTSAISDALGLFASAIKSGEPWTDACQSALDAARKEIAYLSKAAPVGWRPIETAPKDVSILVHYNNGSIELIEEDDNDFDWKPYNGKDETSKGVSSPTHWQPLPAAPVTPGSEG